MLKKDFINKNPVVPTELTRDEALALWEKVILENGNLEDYFKHYKEDRDFQLHYIWIEDNFPSLAEALMDENEAHIEGIIMLGNEALRNIKIDGYRRPKRGYLCFSDNPRLKALALSLHSEEEVKRADAKSAAIAKKDKETPTVEEVLNLEEYNGDNKICNYIVTKRVFNNAPHLFYLEVGIEEGKIKTELTHSRAIPIQTAPSLDFHKHDYVSLNAIYAKHRKEITDYIAFPNESIAPDLMALGCVASYFREVFYTYPYYDYVSSDPECGKTTAMKVQTFLSFYGTIAASITEALLFREIDGSHCFYGLDNIERLFASPKDYASIIDWLLSSYSRDIPCKRLEKTEEGYEVRYFDGYGIKAFTHIRDFPFALRALRSRCIQIVMQTGKPKKFYPSAEKFTEIRDNMYKARLYEFEAVKQCYDSLIKENLLSGRTGDLYYPLLTIAKLVDSTLFSRILHYAKSDEVERREFDGWNIALISVLLEKGVFGTHSTKEIRGIYEAALRNKGILKDSDSLHTRTVTTKMKKLGFEREEKKTENKTWFFIDEEKVMLKAHEYNIIDEVELEKYINTHTLPKPNLSNLPNSGDDKGKPQEGSTEHSEEDKQTAGEIHQDLLENGEKLTKLEKLAKRGVREDTNKVCGICGKDKKTTRHKGEWLCDGCISKLPEQDKTFPTKIGLNICDEKNPCDICNKGEKWGIELPYLVHYPDKSVKTVCKHCGEKIAHESGLELPLRKGGDMQ